MKTNKRQKIKKIVVWALVILMVFPTVVTLAMLCRADEISDLESKLEDARAEQESRQTLINEAKEQQEALILQQESTKQELEALRAEKASIFEQKVLLDRQIGLLNDRIGVIDSTVAELEEGIAGYEEELGLLSAEYEKAYESFRNRVRVTYEDGTASYLSIILSSESMSDLVSRIQMVADILANDRKNMKELKLLGETIGIKRESLESEKTEYEAMVLALDADRAQLQLTVDESIAIMASLADEETANAELLAEYEKLWQEANEEEQRLAQEYEEVASGIVEDEAALSSAIQSREEAESRYLAWSISDSIAKAQAAATTKPPASTQQPSGGSSGGSGKYIWPTPGYYWVTSDFGGRWHPVTGAWNYHSGIDIGAPYGTPVKAIAGGRVIQSEYNDIFGYCIRIDHGDGMVSLYGHFMSRPLYSYGEYVSKGTVLGYVGSTGMSTGAHLHITMIKNGSQVDPEKYLTK